MGGEHERKKMKQKAGGEGRRDGDTARWEVGREEGDGERQRRRRAAGGRFIGGDGEERDGRGRERGGRIN